MIHRIWRVFSVAEINNIKNFAPSIGNVVGEAGSVASNASITLTNASNSTTTVRANRDGSFKAALEGTSGSAITIKGSDGSDKEVSFP